MIKTVFACSGRRNAVALALMAAWLMGCSPVALDGGARVGVTEQPPATIETGATPIPTDGGYRGPGTAAPPATIVPTAEETPPYLRATPRPITYSFETTADWLPYEYPRLGLSLKYPETPPEQVRSSNKEYEWETLNVWIRTGPTLPAVWTNTVLIAIAVHPNTERLPVAEAVMRLDTLYGPLTNIQPNETETRILENLRLAGAEQVHVFGFAFPKPLYGATRGVRLYVLGVGAMTDSEAQDRVFELLTTTLRFSD